MTRINELAELLGFHNSYYDTFGNEIFANEQALSSLITAMGFNVTSEQETLKHIQQLKEKPWRSILPNVHIEPHENSEHHLTMCLPESSLSPHESVAYTISTESGKKIDHSHIISELAELDRHQLADHHFIKYQLPLPKLDMGYHELSLTIGTKKLTCTLIYAPKTCYSIEEASPEKMWGFAAQLYSVKSTNNWGMGDFTDLLSLSQHAAEQGAFALGVNPLHPLFSNNPQHCSPYSPSSRSFLNTLYIDVTNTPLFQLSKAAQIQVTSPAFQDKMSQAKTSELIDHQQVHELKQSVLPMMFNELMQGRSAEHTLLKKDFDKFKQSKGLPLLQLSTYEALYAHFREKDEHLYGWLQWPSAYQQYNSQAVCNFQQESAEKIDYYAFLQWLADQQLSAVTKTCKNAHMPLGLYLDLAVGCDGSGAEIWANQSAYLSGASVGAPPDPMNLLGQNWGLTPMNPIALSTQAYQPLISALRDNMQYAGALRIDHILGLKRQYWVAPNMKANEGTYISFPFDDILRIIALESQRNQCVVIGEDLGTVPEGFSEHMQSAGLLSYKVLFFERWESGLFKRPETYPSQSMATVSTHDLPTLAGWWTANDLIWREQLNLYPDESMAEAEQNNRILDRQRLLAALGDMQLIDSSHCPTQVPPQANDDLLLGTQAYLAHSNSHLHLIQIEDAIGYQEQANVPGTTTEHPNWRRKLPLPEDEIWQQPTMTKLAKLMRTIRPKRHN